MANSTRRQFVIGSPRRARGARLQPAHGVGVAVLLLAFASQIHGAVCFGSEPATQFDREIRPILVRKCIKCHGKNDPKAELQLMARDTATRPLPSGSRAIVPGNVEASELIKRVSAADPSVRMPPEGDPITENEIERLRSWIASGADWPVHWAYRSLSQPAIPDFDPQAATFAKNPIDHFILKGLHERGLVPSPPAKKEALLRRLYIDLIGLPPSSEDLALFMADDSPTAYETVVDRLLASPRYGERWARHWMDVVHFAETHGHDQDRPRPNAWPYRDYLIRSFNEDKPYAKFIQEQIAGDVLFPEDTQAKVALGFLATGPWDESSLRDIRDDSIDREIARYIDRDDMVTTAFSTFLSASVQCARCHDHKFDPISQAEYYSLQAVFAGVDKADSPYDRDPEIAKKRQALLEERTALKVDFLSRKSSLLQPELQAEVVRWEAGLKTARESWTPLNIFTVHSEFDSTLTMQPDGSYLADNFKPDRDIYTITGTTSLNRVTGIRLDLLSDDRLPNNGPGRQDNGNLHLNEIRVTMGPAGTPGSGSQGSGLPVKIDGATADFNQADWTVAMAIDGKPDTAWGIHPEIGKSHWGIFKLAESPPGAGPINLTIRLEQTHGRGHLIGRFAIFVTNAAEPVPPTLASEPPEIVSTLAIPPEQRSETDKARLAAHVRLQTLDRELKSLPPADKVYCACHDFEPDGSFKPTIAPRKVQILRRGNILDPLGDAAPGTVSFVEGMESPFTTTELPNEGGRRAALARWLSDPRNGVAWRSIVNRVWHYHFGRGIVDTPNDFGLMGSSPTHPELLDYLAGQLIASGGSLKTLHRMIVLSGTFRQSSDDHAENSQIDADNKYLWRMNRRRLDAETIRDAVLQASGKLDLTMGGPSVRQFIESPGIHVTPNVDYLNFNIDDPAMYRRSVYRFVFRTLPDPFMESLDCADSSFLTPVRSASITTLQALSMLNDRFIIRQSEHLADRLTAEHASLPDQIRHAFNILLLREPTPEELQLVHSYAEQHGLSNACRFLMNSNEFMFVD